MNVRPEEALEFSRRLRLDRLAGGDVEEELAATAQERAALAKRFGVLNIARLEGKLRVCRPADGPLVRVDGRLRAEVTQTCVVTLEPVTQEVEEAFVQLFTLSPEPRTREVFVSPEDEDAPEPLTGNAVDLGEVLSEQLALALDPYPRRADVEFEGASFGKAEEEDEEARDTPFAALERLKAGS